MKKYIKILVIILFLLSFIYITLEASDNANNILAEVPSNDYRYLEKLGEVKSIKLIEYDGMSLDEVHQHFEALMKGYLKGQGAYFYDKAKALGVDPYMALAIVMHETGCNWNCSYITKNCNNIGGIKGSGCGSYAKFSSLNKGIDLFLENLKYNYIDHGLTNAKAINNKYAENKSWYLKIEEYMKSFKK